MIVKDISDLQKVIKCILDENKPIIILKGTLGSGKTTLVKEFVKYLGINQEVTSPTFSLQNVYGDKIYHYDLYNKDINEFLSLGMLEELQKEGFHFLEWGEELIRYLDMYGFEYLVVEIQLQEGIREFKCIS